jgi:hypothetical protein
MRNSSRFLPCLLVVLFAVSCTPPGGGGSETAATYTVTYSGNGNESGTAPTDPSNMRRTRW